MAIGTVRCVRMLMASVAISLLGILPAAAPSARGDALAELVVDGDFDDRSLAAWSLEIFDSSTIEWIADDASGPPASGALRLRKKLGENPNSVRATQCLELPLPGTLQLSAQLRVPAPSLDHFPFVDLAFFADPGCVRTTPTGLFSQNVTGLPADLWSPFGPFDIPIPEGTRSAVLYLGVVATIEPGAPGEHEVRFDEVSVLPEPASGAGLAAGVALAALARRRRGGRSR
jgi:hypothetical protein